ncbi:MAG TPA: tripartite tricarboxylate transporter permease [Candidatus Nanoarchaeia archaeon]|nr:tripartite tricarboxylate transporter permease [Candidatus Nanoarchaeia archaeon]
MFFELILAIAIGSILGIITGITPGVHINLVAAILFTITPFLVQYMHPFVIAIAIVAMSIVHTFLDILPSTFLGAPDESNIMLALPAHKLLLQGKGYEAVKLATTGSFLGLLMVFVLLPGLLIFIPFIFEALKNYVGIILLLVALFMILRDSNRFWSFFVFCISGCLGIAVFSLNIKEPLFPMLSGLFGVSTLLMSLSQKVQIPEQQITETIHVSKKEMVKSVIAGTLSGTIVSIFPGMGPAQSAVLGGSIVGEIKEHTYLVLVGAIGTVSMLLSLITLFTIEKARNGSIVVVQKMLETIDFTMFILLLTVSLLAACFGVMLTMSFVKGFAKNITKVNYTILSISIIAFIVSLVFFFSGFLGILVLMTSTAIGMLPELVKAGKSHAMGCLLIPVILGFLL